MMVAQLPTVEGEEREREMSYYSSSLFFCFSVLTLFSKQSVFLSQTIPCFFFSIRFSSSSSFPESFAPSSFLFFFFLFPSSFLQLASLFSPKNFSSSAPHPPFLSIPLSIYSQQKRQ
ncbi:hypothetical protein NC653_007421 [Populus alba x Populus x berolinensis]|uniref:Transmembrane protein n=1 Tax=Populus alba x Populus x berolinensis TaxID=444605 RepID=A0AAD6WDW5_9ROSI|nr:hypothetical protein NC653_007421 [Populus alba x Populus x berolinensis]